MLWRLSLFGADVSARAQLLAADIVPLVTQPIYVFNDWHVVMAFGLAGEHRRSAAIAAANRLLPPGTNRAAAERAGLALLEGFSAFAAGDPGRALDLVLDIRPRADAVGGSHAQRDVIDLTLIAAAARAGADRLADALVSERVQRKPSAADAAQRLVEANTPGSRGAAATS